MINANVEEEKLARMKRPRPPGAGHVAVPHDLALKYFKNAMRLLGLRDGQTEIGVTKDGLDMVCSVEADEHDLPLDDAALWFGLVNANSAARRSHVYAGVSIKGLPVAMAATAPMHKHTSNFSLPKEMHDAVVEMIAEAIQFPRRLAGLRGKEYSVGRTDALMLRLSRRKMMAASKLCKMHDAVTKLRRVGNNVNTALELCLAFAKAIERRPPIVYNPRTDRLKQLWEFYSLVADKEG